MLFIKLYIYQKILKNKVYHHCISTQNMKQQIVFNIDNNQKCFLRVK